MANSYQIHTPSVASTGPFSFAQIDGYLSVLHLSVVVNGTTVPSNTYTINETSKEVTFNSAVGAGSVVRIVRTTPKTVAGRFVDFDNASILTAEDLDNAYLQNLYIAQEAEDTGSGALPPAQGGTAWDALNRRITNVGNPLASADAATKGYVDTAVLAGPQGAYTNPQAWQFTGDGTASYSWTANGQSVPSSQEANTFIVEVGGVLQHPVTNYSITPSAIVFTGNVAIGETIRIRNFGIAANLPQWDQTTTFTQPVTFASTVNIGPNNLALSPSLNLTQGGDTSTTGGSVYVGNGGQSAVAPTPPNTRSNTAVGVAALSSVTTGSLDTAVGTRALKTATTGHSNVAIGADAGSGLTTGYQNVVIGNSTDFTGVTGGTTVPQSYNNVLIGHNAGWSGSTDTAQNNAIVIGAGAVSDGTNTTVIGNSSTTQTKLHGNLITTGTGQTLLGGALEVAGNITLKSNGSGVLSAALLPSGTVLQIVTGQTTAGTNISSTDATWIDVGLTASITPRSTSSKILAIISSSVGFNKASANQNHSCARLQLVRGITPVQEFSHVFWMGNALNWAGHMATQVTVMHLDSPGSTAQQTYKVQASCAAGTTTAVLFPAFSNASSQRGILYLIEIA